MQTIFKTKTDWVLGVFFPLVTFLVVMLAERVGGYFCFSACEDGPLEYFQVFIAVVGAVFGIKLLLLPKGRYPLWVRGVFGVGVLACVYIALEEISYGQRIFGWDTSEHWGTINDQNETNLHNTSSWLDQKPRLILEIGVYVGGVILPLLQRFKPSCLPKFLWPVMPDARVCVLAVMAVVSRMLRVFYDGQLINRTSELQEVYLYGFIMLYFIFMYQRYRVERLKA